jgi:hypothetical protein
MMTLRAPPRFQVEGIGSGKIFNLGLLSIGTPDEPSLGRQKGAE